MPSEIIPLKIRTASVADLPRLKELYVSTIQEVCKNDYNPEQIIAWAASAKKEERWQEAVTTQYFQIAESNNKMIGFASLKAGFYIDFLYVHPCFIRRGVAEALFQVLLTEAKKHFSNELSSDVSKTARPFFEKKGFKVVRENKNMVGEIELINYHMIKEL